MSIVGIVNPGAMGISIAAAAKSAGHEVYWASAGRSQASRERAGKHGLSDAGTIDELCARCEIILCVCPPHAAGDVADAVIDADFAGLYCDGNAISPLKALDMGAKLAEAGITFVDGSIIGPPAWEAGTTRFYLSGKEAARVADLFSGTVAEAIVIGDEISRASALKMVFAARTKGTTALVSAIMATAESLGVRGDLEHEWALREADAVETTRGQVRGVTEKAWRFSGEMAEIAETFAMAGLPPGFFLSAQEVYARMAHLKDAEELPALEAVLAALVDAEG